MRLAAAVYVVVGALGLLTAADCGAGGIKTACTLDSDCEPGGEGYLRCDVEQGLCLCTDDRGCGDGEECNALGRCQANSGCNTNDDCGARLFCDVTTSQCLAVDECGPDDGERCCVLDSQCGFGSVCDTLSRKCTPGCRDTADCVLGAACVRGLGQVLGQCAADVCSGDNLCNFGQVCSSDGECESDTRGPYCLGCAGGVASDDCGERGNFCLTDSVNGGEFCGVDCSGGEACPFGYSCNDVIIIPPAAPFCSAEVCVLDDDATTGRCSRNGATVCSTDADCPIGFPGGDCPRARTGNCRIDQLRSCEDNADCADGDECVTQECRFGEGDTFGYCSCTRDSDCPNDRCVDIDPTSGIGNCELSGHDCFSDIDCEAIIECINGGCYIGQNCAPADGRTCRELVAGP
ncbi:MAG: hypothetical protein FJ137_14315 [Deltaproteobacteria bacterium]|nr:hypothetical protein [Deltaproteobacteria bacterium]